MESLNHIKKMILLTVIVLLSTTVYSQQFPTGGFQGGTHGNIKVMTWMGAVATESLAGSTSVMIAPAGAASVNTIRAARIRRRNDIPRDLLPAIGQ